MKFQDIGNLSEDDRIRLIADYVTLNSSQTTGFIVEDDSVKAERYISKLRAIIPDLQIISQSKVHVGAPLILVKVTAPPKQGGPSCQLH